MNIEEKKQTDLIRIVNARNILNNYLVSGLIKEKDILELLKKKSDYGFSYQNKPYKSKENMLVDIFNAPFLLCDQKNLSKKIKDLLPLILSCRYEMEMEELENSLNNCFITEQEYEETKELLRFFYYESSEEGKTMLENGKVVEVTSLKSDKQVRLVYGK